MSFYVKKLYDNELGYRKGIPNKAGKFLLVSKDTKFGIITASNALNIMDKN